MAVSPNPIFPQVPNVGRVLIPTANAQVKSDGTSAGTGADLMYLLFTAGSLGSFIDLIKFWPVASANVSSVACILRAYLSTVGTPGATTNANTYLLGEVSAPAQSAGHTTNAINPFEIIISRPIPNGTFIHVSQSVAQNTNQNFMAMGFGGDY